MTVRTKAVLLFLLFYVNNVGTWTAIPANNARFALRQYPKQRIVPDEDLPRVCKTGKPLRIYTTHDGVLTTWVPDFLHSIYKFGWCTMDSTRRQFLRRTQNVSLATYQETQCQYMYLIRATYTIRFRLQCIVMKVYVPRKFLFRKSRIPMYYCQGYVMVLMFDIYERLAVHEFFLQAYLNLPASFVFEFYHPPLRYIGQWKSDEPTRQIILQK